MRDPLRVRLVRPRGQHDREPGPSRVVLPAFADADSLAVLMELLEHVAGAPVAGQPLTLPSRRHDQVVWLGLRANIRAINDRYRATHKKLGKDATALLGVGRHVVAADTDKEALRIARRAYPRWRESFRWLFRLDFGFVEPPARGSGLAETRATEK